MERKPGYCCIDFDPSCRVSLYLFALVPFSISLCYILHIVLLPHPPPRSLHFLCNKKIMKNDTSGAGSGLKRAAIQSLTATIFLSYTEILDDPVRSHNL